MAYAFSPITQPAVAISGTHEQFPVHRIYCVGRNYAEHAREMGATPEREAPFFFTKPADAIVPNNATVAYPSRTQLFHHEVELVVAIGKSTRDANSGNALDMVFGYAVGNDLTRRDLQFAARDKGRPWDVGKAFDQSAPITAISRVAQCGHLSKGRIWLKVNGQTRQQADLGDLIWSVPEIISELATYFDLEAGDLIFTGTPAGVGVLVVGDRVEAGIDGLETLVTLIGPKR